MDIPYKICETFKLHGLNFTMPRNKTEFCVLCFNALAPIIMYVLGLFFVVYL